MPDNPIKEQLQRAVDLYGDACEQDGALWATEAPDGEAPDRLTEQFEAARLYRAEAYINVLRLIDEITS